MTERDDERDGRRTSQADGLVDGRHRTGRLIDIRLDGQSIRRMHPNVEHEREVAIYDLLDENSFQLAGREGGPYRLTLALVDDRLALRVHDEAETEIATHILALSPFRRVMRDYFAICETYYEAIKTAPPSRIQAIDMGRRGLHNEGSALLIERLQGKIEVDHDTARRLFTLICTLRWKG
ncbi:MAG: UPF0262 family protein [Hyphomicrobiaceae bacterium]